jgi:hypothetical protein
MDERKIVRTETMGVFFGKIEKKEGNEITLSNARRLWYWEGAASLSELAQHGTASATRCKFPCAVDEITLISESFEILSVTEKAAASLDGVAEWKLR